MLEQKIIKVSQLNSLSRKILEANFSHVLIEGEISNLSKPASGHIYFTLKDESAQIRAAMFRQNKRAIKFVPENGAQVIVTAQVSLYEPRGDYQLIVEKMVPAGVGILHTKFLQLKNKLAEENLFDKNRKKDLPKLPNTIGVITSPTGAVIRDILHVMKRRFPAVSVIIYPVMVQGDKAVDQIVESLQIANERKECDLLILARGGGSLEDLWSFNEEKVARAIVASDIPVVSAVGHETDFTIADFVADVRAPTPSAAAELVVPDISGWFSKFDSLKQRMFNLIKSDLKQKALLLLNLKNRLRHPSYYLAEKSQYLDELERRLFILVKHKVLYSKQLLAKAASSLDLVSPLATLKRGYSVITKDRKIIKKSLDVVVGDKIQAKLSDGEIECLVEKIN